MTSLPLPPDPAALTAARDFLLRWLREDALPLWERHGLDRERGGYFEALVFDAQHRLLEAQGDLRRGRVVARQIFCFDAGRRLGWNAGYPDPVLHGCRYLFSRMLRDDGLFHTAIDPRSYAPSAEFSLYECAFYLFALARARETGSPEFAVEKSAVACLNRLRDGWGKVCGGFEESVPPSLPLKSNPHMHLLEAALAWLQASEAGSASQSPWITLAQELVDLCLTRFIDQRTGALREFFDESWQPLPGDAGRLVEPGHQFEWAWLLMQWASSGHCAESQRLACDAAALRLVEIGERWGVDPVRGVAFNELWEDFSAKDTAAKLWPQTERIKAWCALLERATTAAEMERARDRLGLSIEALRRYLDRMPAGSWHEVLLPNDTFRDEPCKASSFYHIVCAIETLQNTLTAPSTDMR